MNIISLFGSHEAVHSSLSVSNLFEVINTQRQDTDPVFSTKLKLVSLENSFAYNVIDKDSNSVGSGDFVSSPIYINNIAAFSLVDPITVYYLKYGFKYKVGSYALTPVETLLFMAQETNPFVSNTDSVAVSNYAPAKIDVDKTAKLITIDSNTTFQEIYDYMQYWQSLPANADTLANGEIYKTYDGNSYILDPAWSITKTGSAGIIYVAISATDRTNQIVAGSNGLYKYITSFTDIDTCLNDPDYGYQDLQANGIKELHYQVFKDGSPYTAVSQIVLDAANYNSTVTNKVILEGVVGEEHKGVKDAGAIITHDGGSNAYDRTLLVKDYNEAHNLEIRYTGGNTNASVTTGAVIVSSAGIATRLLAKSSRHGIMGDSSATGIKPKIISCCSYSCGYQGFFVVAYSYGANFYNCVSLSSGYSGFNIGSNVHGGILKNCLALNNTGSDYSNSSSTKMIGTAIATEDTSGTIPNIPITSVISVAGTVDCKLTAEGSGLLADAGVDVTADIAGYNYDINGQPYQLDPSMPVGCDEPAQYTVPITVKLKDANTSTNITPVGVSVYISADSGGNLAVGTEIAKDVTNVAGEYTYNMPYTGLQPVFIRVRGGSGNTYFKTAIATGTVGGDGLTLTIYVTQET